MSDKELQALIYLLDDPDPEVFHIVESHLINKGINVVPDLEKAWGSTFNEVLHERIERIVHHLQYTNTQTSLKLWIASGAESLLQGVFYIARYQYPDLKLDEVQSKIDSLASLMQKKLNDRLTPLQKVRVLNHLFFEVCKFSHNNANFYAPQNSYINQVLESKKGNPISLGILYTLIAQINDMPIYGVNLPRNYILAYVEENQNKDPEDIAQADVLFYINPFNKGGVLSKKEIDYFVSQHLDKKAGYYLPCKNTTIVERIIGNLLNSYEQLGYPEKVTELESLHALFTDLANNNP